MSETSTAAWGPTARKISPHPFIGRASGNPRWCTICDYSEDAYQHASAEERAAFNEQQAAQAAQRSRTTPRRGRPPEGEPVITLSELARELKKYEGQPVYSAVGLAQVIVHGAEWTRRNGPVQP